MDSGAERSKLANQLWKVRICTVRGDSKLWRYKFDSSLRRSCLGESEISLEIPRISSSSSSVSSSAFENFSNHSCKRERISPAAFLVKVIAKISCGCAPASSARTMRETSIQVLPAPAQACTTTCRCGSQATA